MNRKHSFALLILILTLPLFNPGQTSFAAPSTPLQPNANERQQFKRTRSAVHSSQYLQLNTSTNNAQPLSCRPLGAVITGTVTAQDTGQPVDAYVEADYYGNYGDSAFTDKQGHYVLKNLSPGPHQIYFETRDEKYGSEWYNDHTLGSAATIVNATAGVTTTNINAALDLGGFISGIVTAADTGEPVAGALIEVSDTEGHTVLYTDTDSNGHSSAYLPAWYNDKPNRATANPVNVNMPNLTPNIDFALTRGMAQPTAYHSYLPAIAR